MSGAFGSSQWMYASGAADFYSYSIDQSLRFNDGDSPEIHKTWGTDATDRKHFTVAFWVKRGVLGTTQTMLQCDTSGGQATQIIFDTSNKFRFNVAASGTGQRRLITTRVFRDTSSFYHIVCAYDSEASTASERARIYINGVEETAFDTDERSSIAGTDVHGIMENGQSVNTIGFRDHSGTSKNFLDGYLCEYHCIDGQTLGPTSFGETKNGVWVPKEYSGSYGNNGFHLTFEGTGTATTTQGTTAQTNIGDDQSGSGNNFAVAGLAATDVMSGESPTNNFATMNPLFDGNSAVLSEGNLKVSTGGFSSSKYGTISTFAIPKDKKIYVEIECTDTVGSDWTAGFATKASLEAGPGSSNIGSSGAIMVYNRQVEINDEQRQYTSSDGLGGTGASNLAAGDILGMMCDGATGKVWFSRNGTYFKYISANNTTAGNIGDPDNDTDEIGTITGGTTDDIFVVVSGNTTADDIFVNFGQDSTNVASAQSDANGIGTFEYAPPTDYVCLCSSSLSEPTIGPNSTTQADDYFNTVLYTGDGTSSNAITGTSHQPDFLWIKQRNATRGHQLMDSVRGASVRLQSHGGTAESASALVSFDSDGFTVDGSTLNGTNISGGTFVGWSWKAGGTAVSNTDGSIESSVSANTDAGFSIVSWVGDGNDGATVGHGLNSRVEAVILKDRDNSTNWNVKFKDMTSNQVCFLNTTDDDESPGSGYIGNFTADDTFTLVNGGSAITNVNNSGADIIAYCFHSVDGYSKVGTYIGSTTLPFVFLGFRPAWVMVKRINAGGGWHIFDNKRPNAFNEIDQRLEADNADPENSTSGCELDFVSNGFKLRGTFDNINAAGSTYIFLAFAEAGGPLKYSLAR